MSDPSAAGPTLAHDARFEELVRQRFDALMERFPLYGTYLGLHQYDDRLADGSREAILGDISAARAFLAELEALDSSQLTPYNSFERELAIFATRRQIFDDEVHRIWERRMSGTDEVGDGVFLLFARGARPLAERLPLISSRLESAPRYLKEHRSRLGDRPQRLWNELELDAAGSVPALFAEVRMAAVAELGEDHTETRRLERAATEATRALEEYAGWLRERMGRADDDFALGAQDYAELVGLRAFDGLTPDEILEIGEGQLAENKQARRRIAADIDPHATEEEVRDRIKADHPQTFEAALDAYRTAMDEARSFIVENDVATMPHGESLSVIPTPEYLRKVMPFAAYFAPAKFEPVRAGLYIVTPSVDGDGGAMREHNYASIYNTSIHEAYPGHHQQLSAALEHPSLVRLLVDAPEFVEGWAMYSEQMMREQGFDTAPKHLLMMYTDAIWRACRIILDVKLHRGEISVADAIEFMIRETGFERPNATAEVNRYTYTPTYQLSYLLGKVLLLRLRTDEQRRLGAGFSLRGFHDAMLAQGSLPISFQRRALAGEGAGNGSAFAAER